MEKHFVTYSQALALKEIGFDAPCFGAFDTHQGNNWLLNIKSEFYYDQFSNKNKACLAPLKSQVFEWARKEYRIISVIDFYCDNDEWEDTMYEVRISEFKHFKTHDSFVQSEYKSYEEAESACIDKLIEIIPWKVN
jgi:hypothetical protein